MGMFDDLKQTRDARKALKTEHIVALAKDSIQTGVYRFCYGYNSDEDLQEIEEVLADVNKELKQYKFVITISQRIRTSCRITLKGKEFGSFAFMLQLTVDAL